MARPPSATCFVGNIPYGITEETLTEIFKDVGPVKSIRLVLDRDTGKPRGYAFCEFYDAATAQSAQRNVNGREFQGRPLRVDFADDNATRLWKESMARKEGHAPPQALGSDAAQHAAQAMAAGMGAPPPPPGGDQISATLAKRSRPELYDIMGQMKSLVQQNPAQARQILVQNPQLTKALFQAQLMLGLVQSVALVAAAPPAPAPMPAPRPPAHPAVPNGASGMAPPMHLPAPHLAAPPGPQPPHAAPYANGAYAHAPPEAQAPHHHSQAPAGPQIGAPMHYQQATPPTAAPAVHHHPGLAPGLHYSQGLPHQPQPAPGPAQHVPQQHVLPVHPGYAQPAQPPQQLRPPGQPGLAHHPHVQQLAPHPGGAMPQPAHAASLPMAPTPPHSAPQPAAVVPAVDASQQEALLRQVMSLTPEQIASLPLEQKNQVIALQQHMRAQGQY